MKKWQILEFDGKPYYAFVPENKEPIDIETIPIVDDVQALKSVKAETTSVQTEDEESMGNDASFYDYEYFDGNIVDDKEYTNSKPILLNGIDNSNESKGTEGDLYQVKVEGSIVTLEKLTTNFTNVNENETKAIVNKVMPIVEIEEEEEEGDDEEVGDEGEVEEEIQQIESLDEEDNQQAQEVPEYLDADSMESEQLEYLSEEPENIGAEEEDEHEEDVDDVEELDDKSNDIQMELQTKNQRQTKYRSILPNNAGALKCKVCSETFGSAIAFRKHVAWTHKKKVCIQEDGAYICAVCDYRTLKKSLFATHLERKHETWPRKGQNSLVFPCAVCGFVCRSKHSLQSHFIRKHTDKYEHECGFCPKKFKVKGDLTNHIRFHHKEKPINCDVCNKLCLNSSSLYVHKKWAHYKPDYECPICKRRMVTQENLDQHMVTQHEKREKIVCAECGKTFTKKDSFKRHMAVHTGSKPHHCPICNKPFARQSQLRQHVLIHTGKRPFVCDICNKAFTQKPGLICHRKTHPGPHPPLPVMPIADLVKEFTAEYMLQESGQVNDDAESTSE